MSIVSDILFGKKKVTNVSLNLDLLKQSKINKLVSYDHYLVIKDSYLFKKHDPLLFLPNALSVSRQKPVLNNFISLFPIKNISNYLLMDVTDDGNIATRTNFTFSGLSFTNTTNFNLTLRYLSFQPSNSTSGSSSLILRLKYNSSFYYEIRVERSANTQRISYLYYNGSGSVTQASGVTYSQNGYLSITKNGNDVLLSYSADGTNYTTVYTRTDVSNNANTVCELSFVDTQSLIYYCAINFSYNIL